MVLRHEELSRRLTRKMSRLSPPDQSTPTRFVPVASDAWKLPPRAVVSSVQCTNRTRCEASSMKKNMRVVLAATAAALILACASSANAQYVVQIPVDSILDGRAVTTLTGGAIVTFGKKQGIYSGGQTGY